jgi:hypothetical protein
MMITMSDDDVKCPLCCEDFATDPSVLQDRAASRLPLTCVKCFNYTLCCACLTYMYTDNSRLQAGSRYITCPACTDPKGFKGHGHVIDRKHCRHLLFHERSGCVEPQPITTLDAVTQQQGVTLEEWQMANSQQIETIIAGCNQLRRQTSEIAAKYSEMNAQLSALELRRERDSQYGGYSQQQQAQPRNITIVQPFNAPCTNAKLPS